MSVPTLSVSFYATDVISIISWWIARSRFTETLKANEQEEQQALHRNL
jgi:hypothetical protein